MTDQAREARRLYKKEWNRRNKDKVKAAQARYWEKKAATAEAAGADEPGQGEKTNHDTRIT